MRQRSKIALSMLILLALGCARKKFDDNIGTPKNSMESTASSPMPNPDPTTLMQVVENAKAAASEVSAATEDLIVETDSTSTSSGGASTAGDTKALKELKDATDAVKNEDSKQLEKTFSNPKLNALSWDLLMSQSFEQDHFENQPRPALHMAGNEAYDTHNQSGADLLVSGAGRASLSTTLLGGAIVVVSAAIGLSSYLEDRSLLTEAQKRLLEEYRDVMESKIYLNDSKTQYIFKKDNQFYFAIPSITDFRYKKFLKRNNITPPEKLIYGIQSRYSNKEEQVNLDLKKWHSYQFADGKKFWNIEDRINAKLRSPKNYQKFVAKDIRAKSSKASEAEIQEEISKKMTEYNDFVKTTEIRPGDSYMMHMNKLQTPTSESLRPRSSLNKLGIGGGLAGVLVGGGLMAYSQVSASRLGLAESQARTRLKKALEALSEVESQLWDVRASLGIGK